METAEPLARALGITPRFRAGMHENDRSATGFLPRARFEALADRFFADPDVPVMGWETARAAQTRIVTEVSHTLDAHRGGDLLFVGHGAVGTLLFCALSGLDIDRRNDQPDGGGQCFAFEIGTRRVIHGWQPMEHLSAT